MSNLSADSLIVDIKSGNKHALSRAITLCESSHPDHLKVIIDVLDQTISLQGRSTRIGICGAPGAGKSTLIDAIGQKLLQAGKSLAVLSIDPSSPHTGGSILGDKIRMAQIAQFEQCYIRPSPSRGKLGGITKGTRESILLCEVAGFDFVIVETVGLGQSETEIANIVDCVAYVALPNAGDDIQAMKRGLLEVVDCVIVNKCDSALEQQGKLACSTLVSSANDLQATRTKNVVGFCVSAQLGSGIDETAAYFMGIKSDQDLFDRREDQLHSWLTKEISDGLTARLKVESVATFVTSQIQSLQSSGKSVLAKSTQIVDALVKGSLLEK
jgi:LAO/AO transport system kinase